MLGQWLDTTTKAGLPSTTAASSEVIQHGKKKQTLRAGALSQQLTLQALHKPKTRLWGPFLISTNANNHRVVSTNAVKASSSQRAVRQLAQKAEKSVLSFAKIMMDHTALAAPITHATNTNAGYVKDSASSGSPTCHRIPVLT